MAKRYILLPQSGLKARDKNAAAALFGIHDAARGVGFGNQAKYAALSNQLMSVLDSTNEDGPKLVELDPATADQINSQRGPLRAFPEVIYRLPRQASYTTLAAAPLAPVQVAFTVTVTDSVTHNPLANIRVVAFDNYSVRSGVEGYTDAHGAVALHLPAGQIDRLYVINPAGYWGGFRTSIPVGNVAVPLDPLNINYNDAIRTLFPNRKYQAATGVRVGVLDTGVGPHNEINIAGGECTVTGQPAGAFADIDEHGTHVSGLIGGRGISGAGVRGMAPNIPIYGFRVFENSGGRLGASNYSILKAMILAQSRNLDILNLSLGGGASDPIVEEAIVDARDNGLLVVIAAGNDGRKPVSYPAAYPGATAVTAMGREGTFPPGSMDEADILRPPQPHDPPDFIAEFSNVGPQVSCTGLGVSVLSTLPNNKFGPMSGTSMAAPMVAGCAASLLSQDVAIYNLPRNRQRSDAIEKLLQTTCVRRFGAVNYEGYGLPDPTRV